MWWEAAGGGRGRRERAGQAAGRRGRQWCTATAATTLAFFCSRAPAKGARPVASSKRMTASE